MVIAATEKLARLKYTLTNMALNGINRRAENAQVLSFSYSVLHLYAACDYWEENADGKWHYTVFLQKMDGF